MKLVFLGRLVDLAGAGESDFAVTKPLDWNALLQHLSDAFTPDLSAEVAGEKVRVALNGTVLEDKQSLTAQSGDEVAFLPPVSGG